MKRFFAFALLILACGSSDSDPKNPPLPTSDGGPTSGTVEEAEAALYTLISDARTAAALQAVARVPAADEAARAWASEMKKKNALESDPNLETSLNGILTGLVRSTQLTGKTRDVKTLFDKLMASPEHKALILDPGFNFAGIGIAGDGDLFWVAASLAEATAGPGVNPDILKTGGRMSAKAPVRILDTRNGTGGIMGKLAPSAEQKLVVGDAVLGPSANRVAAVLNVTIAEADAAGTLSVFPCGKNPGVDVTSLSYQAGMVASNLVTVAHSDTGICFLSSATTHVIADLVGSYAQGAGSLFVPVPPSRVLDSRDGTGGRSTPIAAGETYTFPIRGKGGVAASADAVWMNMAVTGSTAGGFVTVFPCGGTKSDTSNVNYAAGQTVATSVVSGLSGDNVCIFALQQVHVILDVGGYFNPATGDALTTIKPKRLLDTRQTGGAVPDNGTVEIDVAGQSAIGPTATSVSLNVTVTGATAPGFATLYPCGGAVPTTSNVNYGATTTIANSATVKVGANGKVCALVNKSAHVVVDTIGFFAPP